MLRHVVYASLLHFGVETAKDKDLPIETYLDVIDLKKIVEVPTNWDLFKDSMSVQLPNEKKGQQKYLKWIERLNEVRRIAAHPMNRTYKDEDIEFLDFIKGTSNNTVIW